MSVRIRAQERILFTKRLAQYLHAGISILDALHILQGDSLSRAHTRIVVHAIHAVQHGTPLSDALRAFPHAYPSYSLQILSVGEATGTLPQSLARLSEMLSKRSSLMESLRRACAYPLLIAIGTCVISFFLIALVLPSITPLIRGLHAELPKSTRALLWTSSVISQYWLLLISTLIICVIGASRLLAYRKVRTRIEYLLLGIPGVGKLIRAYSLTMTFGLLETLLKSGVRLDVALEFVILAARNTVYQNSLTQCVQIVTEGRPISRALAMFPSLYPRTVIQIISTGERTGSLSSSAGAVAELFEEEAKDRLASLSALLEPVLLLCMGLLVGFVALATIAPMYALTQNLSAH